MPPPCQPAGLDHVWAKSPPPGSPDGQTLVEHTWQVLSRLADLIRLRPALPALIGQPDLWHILFWAAFLHDFGKAAKGFQQVLRGRARRWPYRHEVLSLAFIEWLADGLPPTTKTCPNWNETATSSRPIRTTTPSPKCWPSSTRATAVRFTAG
jgi:CRISPR-associated endonuclease/helicase Cas3